MGAPVFSQRGGAGLDISRWGWPHAKLTVGPHALRLDVFLFSHYEFPKSSVVTLKCRRSYAGMGLVRIEFAGIDKPVPRPVTFVSPRLAPLVEALEQAGYPVEHVTRLSRPRLGWPRERRRRD
jgi:hypothetical protein